MTQPSTMDALKGVVNILQPLSSEERARIFHAALVLLGDAAPSQTTTDPGEGALQVPPRASTWMKQNAVTGEQVGEVFHIANGAVDVIASHLPGKSKREQTLNAYILAGLVALLTGGEPSFDDKSGRALCEKFGCFDNTNHSTILKSRGNEFSGTKDKGWVLTAPGLKRGAELIKEMANPKT
jgi:hypothetical protein